MKSEATKSKQFTSEELSIFCDQIAMLLNSGISLYDGIYMVFVEVEDKKKKEIFGQLEARMKENMPFYQALESVDQFPTYMVQMVKVGEHSGKLEEVMKSLSTYYERETSIKASIRNAITYPIILFFMMSVIIMTLSWKILPLFEDMFHEINKDVSNSTQQMMKIGITAGTVIAIVTCIVMIIILLSIIWRKTRAGDELLRSIVKKSRITNKLSEEIAVNKFISGMSLMISSGMNMNEALEIVQGITEHEKVREKVVTCYDKVNKNLPFEEAIKEVGLIGGMESRMISIASKTGAMDTAFAKLSDQYNVKTTNALNRLSTMIETILVVSLSVMVGGILISIMLPLVSMISSIG